MNKYMLLSFLLSISSMISCAKNNPPIVSSNQITQQANLFDHEKSIVLSVPPITMEFDIHGCVWNIMKAGQQVLDIPGAAISYARVLQFPDRIMRITPYDQGFAIFVSQLNKQTVFGLATGEDDFKNAKKFKYMEKLSNSRALAYDKNGVGVVDVSGAWIVKPGKYKYLGGYHEGLCSFLDGMRWGFLDTKGDIVIKAVYEKHAPPFFREGFCNIGELFEQTHYIDHEGNIVISFSSDEAYSFSQGLAVAKDSQSGRFGFINSTSRFVIKPQYQDAYEFSEGLAHVKVQAKSHNGNLGIPKEGYSRWGYIDKKGQFVIPAIYQDARLFSEGLAAVCQDDKWGIIDREGNSVVAPQYDDILDFYHGYAAVKTEGMIGVINRQGEIVIPPFYPYDNY